MRWNGRPQHWGVVPIKGHQACVTLTALVRSGQYVYSSNWMLVSGTGSCWDVAVYYLRRYFIMRGWNARKAAWVLPVMLLEAAAGLSPQADPIHMQGSNQQHPYVCPLISVSHSLPATSLSFLWSEQTLLPTYVTDPPLTTTFKSFVANHSSNNSF